MYFGLRPVAVKTGGNINIVHTDYLATPRVVTSGGSVVWQWKNDNPYGYNQAQGTIEFNLRFAGQYYDYESGLHYNIHRTYNPEIGRYMQSDPIGLVGGSNTYNYVERNPLSAINPDGHNPFVIGGIGFIAGGLTNGLNYYSQGKSFWKGAAIGAGIGAIAAFTEPALAVSAAGRAAMNLVSSDLIAGAIGGAGTQLLNRIDGVNLLDTGHPVRDCLLEPFLAGGVGGALGGIFGRLAGGLGDSTANVILKQHLETYKVAIANAYTTSYTNIANAYTNLGSILH